ncbi:hypothetical protein TNCV_1669841 [Trichonephila clavipes]|nr:hypothetical protein TNCV_1669841 [Trichonephila clavipes]
MLVGLLLRSCFLIGGHGRRQWAGRTGDFGGLRKNQVQIRASRREARLLLVVRSRSTPTAADFRSPALTTTRTSFSSAGARRYTRPPENRQFAAHCLASVTIKNTMGTTFNIKRLYK